MPLNVENAETPVDFVCSNHSAAGTALDQQQQQGSSIHSPFFTASTPQSAHGVVSLPLSRASSASSCFPPLSPQSPERWPPRQGWNSSESSRHDIAAEATSGTPVAIDATAIADFGSSGSCFEAARHTDGMPEVLSSSSSSSNSSRSDRDTDEVSFVTPTRSSTNEPILVDPNYPANCNDVDVDVDSNVAVAVPRNSQDSASLPWVSTSQKRQRLVYSQKRSPHAAGPTRVRRSIGKRSYPHKNETQTSTFQTTVSKPDPPLDPASDRETADWAFDTMTSCFRDDDLDHGMVTKQFLPRGNVASNSHLASPPPTKSASASDTLSQTQSLPPQAAWPSTDSSSSIPSRGSPVPSTFGSFHDISLTELLEQDDRPTFVVDLANTANFRSGSLQILYSNPALLAEPSVVEQLTSSKAPTSDDFGPFKSWVLDVVDNKDKEVLAHIEMTPSPPVPSPHAIFAGLRWTSSTLRRRYRVIRGAHCSLGGSANASTDVSSIPPSSPASFTQETKQSIPATWIGTGPGASTAAETATPQPLIWNADNNSLITPTPKASTLGSILDGIPTQDLPKNDYFGDDASATVPSVENAYHESGSGTAISNLSVEEDDRKQSFDWTRISLESDLPPHIRFARSIDWAATSLGPIESWPVDLRIMANMVMGSPHPCAMYWGPNFTVIYNESYAVNSGKKHPQLMGASYPEAWSELWDTMKPVFNCAWNAGQAILKHDDQFFINRNGYMEETYFDWSIVPLVGNDGSVVALYNPSFEITRRKINERRMLTLREVGEKTSTAQTVSDFWHQAQQGLEFNEYDVPFALLYTVSGLDEASESNTTPSVVLEGSLGVPDGHPAAVRVMDLATSNEGFAPYMRQAMETTRGGGPSRSTSLPALLVLSADDGSLPTDLLPGLQESQRGFGDPIRTVVVFPVLRRTAQASASAGFVILGTNPRRPYDRDYRLFVQLLARQLATSLTSVMLFEDSVRHCEEVALQAAQDHQELSQQLVLRTQQAVESENKFMRMAEFTPVGMFVTDAHGGITYCNDMWWAISRHPRASKGKAAAMPGISGGRKDNSAWATWMESVHEEDQPTLRAVWDRLVHRKEEVTHEFRFKRKTLLPQTSDDGETTEITTWVLLRASPEKDEETGELRGIFGCITDISQQKLAEEFQTQRHQEVVEHKRQQENFIDITSHEMRNPLSAILQSVDEITNSVDSFKAGEGPGEGRGDLELETLLTSVLEASSTISLCANHQKRIVDDVLTLSKLDSRLLLVKPVEVQPVVVVRNTLKMFEAELVTHDIHCTFRVQPSFQNLIGNQSAVKLDPSRLNQILINLLTNAIKFTQASEHRSLTISLGASQDDEPYCDDLFEGGEKPTFVLPRQDGVRPGNDANWGTGPTFNLHFAVADTGIGLQEDDKRMLFQRFSQASPRTHVRYGGSGLGLFICRTLAELQGGQIGVTSAVGQGSTFAFYIKCRKVLPATATATATAMAMTMTMTMTMADSAMEVPATAPLLAYSAGGAGNVSSDDSSQVMWLSSPTLAIPMEDQLPPILHAPLFPHPPPVDATSDGSNAPSTPANEIPGVDVLIVEDNLVNQRVLQRQLNRSGNRTHVANHGEEALEALRQSRYWKGQEEEGSLPATQPSTMDMIDTATTAMDVDSVEPQTAEAKKNTNISIILMDLEMPVMDGLTCARAIRALEEAGRLERHVPIIAVTAYARQEQIESAKAAGIDDVISKPFRLAQLMPKIHELVAKYDTW